MDNTMKDSTIPKTKNEKIDKMYNENIKNGINIPNNSAIKPNTHKISILLFPIPFLDRA